MAMQRDWSELPSDLINRVTDCFLATNDIDYYKAFRAVCGPWRRVTDDPRSSPPSELQVVAHLYLVGTMPNLVLVCHGPFSNSGKFLSVYSVEPSSECLRVEHEQCDDNDFCGRDFISVLCRISHKNQMIGDLVRETFSSSLGSAGERRPPLPCFLVESAGETLRAGGQRGCFEVLELDAAMVSLEPVTSLGRRALFISQWRCLLVDACMFPFIRGNCIILHDKFPVLGVYDLTDRSFSSLDVTEASLIHLLSDYCSNNPHSQLGVERFNNEFYLAIRAAFDCAR